VDRRWWRAGQWLAGLLVVAFMVRFVARNWAAIRAEPIAWHLSPGWIALSLALVLATYAVQVESWRRMLAGWGPRLGWLEAARVWVLSSMGKYLPGKVWAVAGMALLARRRGVPPWAATASAILLQVVAVGTGALVTAATGMAALELERPGSRVALLAVMAASLAVLAAVLSPRVARGLVALGGGAGQGGERLTPPAGAVVFGISANLVAWVVYGLALWCLARGTLPLVGLPVTSAVGAFAGSYIAGLLFLLAPGGLGVREGVFVLMLQDRIGPANALALAAVSRLGMTLADALAVVPFLSSLREGANEAA
jgi:hypothetical protein